MNQTARNRRTIISIFRIIRVHIVVGGFLAFLLGVLLAVLNKATFTLARVALGYLVVFFGDLSTHYSNDYFDAETKQTGGSEKNKMFGGSSVLTEHPELRPLSLSIAIALMLLSIALAFISVSLYNVPKEFLVIAITANLLGWFYSAPPLHLSSRGLGEAAIGLGTGLFIPASGYLVTMNQLDTSFLLLTIPFMMYGFILSLSLEAPDMEDDLKVGKTNLVVRKGRHFTFSTITVLSVLATVLFLMYAKSITPATAIDLEVVTVFSSIPLAAGLVGFLKKPEKREEANRLGAVNIAALFLFNIILNAYFIILLF
jgi:1,4-dihydroxy-2-naphthoate octaprenyltransferase